MKKWHVAVAILVLCFLLLLLPYFAFVAKQAASFDESIEESIGIKIPDYQDRKYVSEKGWFGDGIATTLYQFDDENAKLVKELILQEEQWHALPLTKSVNEILERDRDASGRDPAKEADLPYIENGYWYFSDESPSATAYDGTGIYYGAPMNFDLAIFDSDTNRLYFYESDS
jgi:hypothetical protein